MRFTYTAVSKEGKSVSGSSEASSKEALTAILTRQGLRPVVIKMASSRSGLAGRMRRGKKVKLKDLVIFTRQLSTMVGAGVPLSRSLAMLQTQTDSKYFATVIAAVNKDIEGGQPLGDERRVG